MPLTGRVLILTGSTGIAAATAHLAVKAGARVLVAASHEESTWQLGADTGAECWIGDLTNPTAADSVLHLCLTKFGRVDALFQAAGQSGRRFGDGPIDECTDEGWDVTLAHNLGVMFRFSRAVIGRMLQQPPDAHGTRGAIVNMGSVLARFPEPHHFAHHAYAAAKGAVESMSRSMAAYYAPQGIRVNVVAPALVRTPASQRSQSTPELQEFLRKKQPLSGGMVEAEDVARAALFLLGEESRFITGEVLAVDGGWSVTAA